STSAAPTYLPAHNFNNQDSNGNIHKFNLIDGGVCANNPGRILIISIGTGTSINEEKFNAQMAAKWGLLDWLTQSGSTPLINVFTQSSADMDDTLTGTDSSVDIATKENLEKLSQIRENLLKKPVSGVNLENGLFQPLKNGQTNEHALKRRLREMRSPHTKKAF
ncbi:Patatin-like protein 3, partial [Glycine soja]